MSIQDDILTIGGSLLAVMSQVDRLQKNQAHSRKELLEALRPIVHTLESWGLGNLDAFRKKFPVPDLCWALLKQRDGKEYWEEPARATVDKVFEAIHGEYQNLVRLLYQEEGGNLDQAKGFCMRLHRPPLKRILSGARLAA